jgi:hypothetical protein
MLSLPPLHDDLLRAVEAMAGISLHQLLQQQGILRKLARDLALNGLRQGVRLSHGEGLEMLAQACAGLPFEPPASLDGDWIGTLPEPCRDTVKQRWNQLLLEKALDDHYGERVEAHFLARRDDLEQLVFRLMRLPQRGLAEEFYLRLVDDQVSFGDLACRHSLGDERMTRGIVGPIEIGQLHNSLRTVLRTLAEGECHPPFQLDNAIVLVRLEHRRPACLTDALRSRLMQELLEPDLQEWIEAGLAALAGTLAPVAELQPSSLVMAGG